MEAEQGMWFLIQLLYPSTQMGKEQIELAAKHLREAIRIASTCEPSSAIKQGKRYYRMHCINQMHVLAFGKGTRWLAMIRRDKGQKAFEAAVQELKMVAMDVCSTCGSTCIMASIESCKICNQLGCQRCLARYRTTGSSSATTWHTTCRKPV